MKFDLQVVWVLTKLGPGFTNALACYAWGHPQRFAL